MSRTQCKRSRCSSAGGWPEQVGRIVVAAGKEVADLGFDFDTIAMRLAKRLNNPSYG